MEENAVVAWKCDKNPGVMAAKYFASQSGSSSWAPQIRCWLGYLFVYLCGKPWLSIYEISPKWHSGWLNKTESHPQRLSSVMLPKQQNKPYFELGFCPFFSSIRRTRQTGSADSESEPRHITRVASWERLWTTITQCSMPSRRKLTPHSRETTSKYLLCPSR